jgi:hypothetical protein
VRKVEGAEGKVEVAESEGDGGLEGISEGWKGRLGRLGVEDCAGGDAIARR